MELLETAEPTGPSIDDAGVRTRLLIAAGDLFYRDGIRAVGVQRLLDEAQVARASFYAHFRGKDALVAAYLEHQAAAWRLLVRERVLDPPLGDAERVLALFEVLGEWMANGHFRGCPFANAARELPDPASQGAVIVAQQRAWQRDLVTTLVRRLDLPSGATIAAALLVLLDGAAVAAAVDGARDSAAHARWAARALLEAHGATC